jgi:hypothetical protein
MYLTRLTSLVVLVVLAGTRVASSAGAPVIDGSADEPLYRTPLVEQDTETAFRDASLGRPDIANGSELDAAYGVVYDDVLYLVLAGNIETNGNRIDIFFDTRPGGQNTLIGQLNPDVDFRALYRMGFSDGFEPDPMGPPGPGLTFPSGFEADFFTSIKPRGDPVVIHVNYAELYVDESNPGVGYYLGQGRTKCETDHGELAFGDPAAPFTVLCTIDNSNVLGVPAGVFAVWPPIDPVYTGLELAIPLSAIGDPAGAFQIVAFINNERQDYVSNQLLGGLGGSDNLGEPRFVDLAYVVPFTVSAASGGVGACCDGMNCILTDEQDCLALNGTYLGDNVSCAGNPCAGTPGRCCIDDGYSGTCAITTAAECTSLAGVFDSEGTCEGCPCLLTAPGACCLGETCEEMREADCLEAGGTYLGPFTACGADTCVYAACCIDGECQSRRPFECAIGGGRYMGSGRTCAEGDCSFTVWSPHVATSLHGWDPTTFPMTETATGSGIYTVDITGSPGEPMEFKITDGTWQFSVPASNSWCYFPPESTLTITYDANTYADGWLPERDRIGLDYEPGSWLAVGDFQYWDNWDYSALMDDIGGGLYQRVITGLFSGGYCWKAVQAGTWDAIGPHGRSLDMDCVAFSITHPWDEAVLSVNALAGTIRADVWSDCNQNGIEDTMDLADCPGQPWCSDCNVNAVLDVCDISSGTSYDSNGNGVPDECDDIGACCLGDMCVVTTPDECASAGGATLGAGTICEDSPCGASCDVAVINGRKDLRYSSPLAVQDTQTQFGDNSLAMVDFANGSELDSAYAYISDDSRLNLLLTGNLEANFNKLEIFFDTRPGGQNRLRGDNPDVDYNGLNRMGDDGTGNGLTFDSGFEADYWVGVTGGNNPYELYVNYAELANPGTGRALGMGRAADRTHGGLILGDNPGFVLATIHNGNAAGVAGGTSVIGSGERPGNVQTGIEISLPLAEIGNPTGAFKIVAFINAAGHDWVSNQVLGPIGGGGNLGEPRTIDLGSIPGNQYFVVPAPGTALVTADFDQDCDVDADDLRAFERCASGPGLAADPECSSEDLDQDGDVDQTDFSVFQRCYSGENVPADPNCAN